MSQSLSRIWLHIVFSTKERRSYLQNAEFREEMGRMLGHHAKQSGCPPVRVGGWHDYAHVLCGFSRTTSVADLVETLKTETSKWIKVRSQDLSDFHWQSGYGAFSVQEELRLLCAKHHVEIDERYVWD